MENVAKFPVDCMLFDNMSLKDSKGISAKPLNNFRELLLQGNKSEALGKCIFFFIIIIN